MGFCVPRTTWIVLKKRAAQQGGWSVECDPQTKDWKAVKSIKQPTRREERRQEITQITEMMLGWRTILAEENRKGKRHILLSHPRLRWGEYYHGLMWMRFLSCSIWVKKHRVHLSSYASSFACRTRRRGAAYFLNRARQKQAPGSTCCSCQTCPGCVEHRRKGHWGLEDNFPKDQRLISWAEGELRKTQMKRKEGICALITDDRVCCLAALWSQFINIRLETNPKRADCVVTGSHTRDAAGETWQKKPERHQKGDWLLTADRQIAWALMYLMPQSFTFWTLSSRLKFN